MMSDEGPPRDEVVQNDWGGEQKRRRDRLALAAVTVQFFANGAMTASFAARAPQLRDNVGVDVEVYGLLLTASAAVGILSGVLAGRIIHAATTRLILFVGAAAMALALPLIGVARDPLVLLVGLSSYVFFDALVDVSMNLQGSWLSARRSTPVMNRLHGVWSVGMLSGSLGAIAANSWSWTPSLHLSAASGVLAMVLLFTTRQLLPDEEQATDSTGGVEKDPRFPRSKLSHLPLTLIILSGVFAVMMEGTTGDWATFRLADDLAASDAVASGALVAYNIGMAMMRLGGDHLTMLFGTRWLHRLSLLIASFGVVIASLIASKTCSFIGFLFVGLGVASLMPKLYDDAARVPGRRGEGLGAMTAGIRIALLLTPAVVAGLVHTGLSIGAAIAICSLTAAAGLLGVDALRNCISNEVRA